jgi:hypothetical protein
VNTPAAAVARAVAAPMPEEPPVTIIGRLRASCAPLTPAVLRSGCGCAGVLAEEGAGSGQRGLAFVQDGGEGLEHVGHARYHVQGDRDVVAAARSAWARRRPRTPGAARTGLPGDSHHGSFGNQRNYPRAARSGIPGITLIA